MPPTTGFLEDKIKRLEAEVARLRLVEKEAVNGSPAELLERLRQSWERELKIEAEVARLRAMGLALLEEWWWAEVSLSDHENGAIDQKHYERRKAEWLGQPEVTDVPR